MTPVLAFLKTSRPSNFLDFKQCPKLELQGDLVFQHGGELYEHALEARFLKGAKTEIQAFDARGRFYAACEEAYLNLVYLTGLRWPSQVHSVVLLNAPNKTLDARGRRVGGRYCDIWWFSEDRHALYSIIPEKAVGQSSSWPPRNSDIYRRAMVGMARQPWPLMHDEVRDVLPGPLLQRLLQLRASCKMTAEEQQILRFIEVPPPPSERKVRQSTTFDVLPHADVVALEAVHFDFEEDVDVVFKERAGAGLWRWVYCLSLAWPCLLREGSCPGDGPYLDFTEPLMQLVRVREMGLDLLAGQDNFLKGCMDVVLDCCPPLWRREARAGAVVCPFVGMVLLSAKSWRLFLGAIPLPLRIFLDLRSPSGLDPACVWTTTGEGTQRKLWWVDERGMREAAPPSFCVKNTRFARLARDSFGLEAVQQLTWSDLKMFEVLGRNWAEAGADEEPPAPGAVAWSPTRAEELRPAAQPPLDAAAARRDVAAESLQGDIEASNEAAHRDRAERRKAVGRKPRAHFKKDRRCQIEHVPEVEPAPNAKAMPKSTVIAKVPIKENDDDLDALLALPNDERKASQTFRAIGKSMKRALWKERRDEIRQRLHELCC
jgi:hypothetical protein